MLQNINGRNEIELSRGLPEQLTRVPTGEVPDAKASAYLHLFRVEVNTSRALVAFALQKIEEFAVARTQVKDSRIFLHRKIRPKHPAKDGLNTGQQIRRLGRSVVSRP
jgi:hypothetical protein